LRPADLNRSEHQRIKENRNQAQPFTLEPHIEPDRWVNTIVTNHTLSG